METNAAPEGLSISEGVLLGHALVAWVADSVGIRAFFIKGPASVMQGLRPPKVSVDVDVFVAPADLESLVAGLHERGWRQRIGVDDESIFYKHSVTLNHPFWPCHIDIHFRFPGMEKEPADAFEAMWARTEEVAIAGRLVLVHSKELGIVLLALHALRAPYLQTSQQELAYLKDLAAREALATIIYDISAATDALAAMRPFLEKVLPGNERTEWPEPSTEWRNRLFSREPGSARIIALLQAPLRDKPRMLRAALMPADSVYLSQDPTADLSPRGRLRAYSARWLRFLRAFPRLIRDLAAYRKAL
jgi:hypothetical protein